MTYVLCQTYQHSLHVLFYYHHTPLSMNIEEFEDTKGVIRIRISKKNRKHNGQKKKYKRTNNDLHNIHIKLKIEYLLSTENIQSFFTY
jgi:hypothetical protein